LTVDFAFIHSHILNPLMTERFPGLPHPNSVPAGTRMGPYEILSPIGAGGMGEVYRARDSRLHREVAIKISAERFSERFEQEAHAIASLNHPNICTLHDVGPNYLVMELVDGLTLAERIEEGPVPRTEALAIARQIVDALDSAHERGIIHRDLKPANVKITPDGRVKVLDFGLAKTSVSPGSNTQDSPTWSTNLTESGVVMGTASYMAPEQARGMAVDKRADIWAFGVLLYELLTGERPFKGSSVSDIVSAVLKENPDFNRVPVEAQHLIKRCLEKDSKRRLRDIGDAWPLLEETTSGSPRHMRGRLAPAWVLAFVGAAIIATAGVIWNLRPTTSAGPAKVAHLSVTLQPGEVVAGASGAPIALSPDGSMIAYVSTRVGETQQLYLRAIGNPEAKAVAGSEGAFNPFFSFDGKSVGFFSQGKLKKVRLAGGAVETLCDSGSGLGGSWAEDGTIYFGPASRSGLWKVGENGGTPQEFTTLDPNKGEVSHRWPQILPGGKALIFTVWTGPAWDESQLQLLVPSTGERRVLAEGARTGRYVSGHLIYSRDGTDTLMAIPFDLDRLQVGAGPPVTLAESVMDTSEGGEFAVSDSGALAYVRGNPKRYESRLVWVDRSGTVDPVAAPVRGYQEPAISPDGRHVAISIYGPVYGVQIYDFLQRTLTPLIAAGSSQGPIWTPDGKRVVYRGTRKGFRNLFWRAVDGGDNEEQLTQGENNQTPGTWSLDGRELIFSDADRTTGFDLWSMSLGDRKQKVLLQTQSNEWNPHLSPDGRWLAYASNESGRPEVWVQPFPALNTKRRISTEGGLEPAWSRDGRELFYRNGNKMMSVQIAAGSAFSASPPRLLFEKPFQFSATANTGYDVGKDGRFLMVQPTASNEPDADFRVVLNWFEELRRK
jgi:serine/threonine-protein kinase